MGCSTSSLLLSDGWKPCACDAVDDYEMEWSATTSSSPKSLPCGYPSKSSFNLEERHPSEPPYLGSVYWLPSPDVRYSSIKNPPPLLTVSPSECSIFSEKSCSTSDKTVLISNRDEHCGSSVGSISPKRLFESPESEDEDTPNNSEQNQSPAVIHHGVLVKGSVESPCQCSSSKYAPRQKRINTLPSTKPGRPIRLRVIESYSSGEDSEANDCSFDPYFSSGEYHIQTSNGSPYGNSLSVQMGPQNMTLQDGDGNAVAVMRSRHTSEPSWVVYGPRPRYASQTKSDAVQNDRNSWYPWALIKKDGPAVNHDASLHLNTPRGWGPPVWKGRHGFVGNSQTHTVVTRVLSEIEEVPCCFVLRDPINLDAFHLTIAPGIDPLLVICYLAVHSKMDVEPLMACIES